MAEENFSAPSIQDQRTKNSSSCMKRKIEEDNSCGNYKRYYGYRYPSTMQDPRLDLLKTRKDYLLTNKDILDIGCNCGMVSLALAKNFEPKSIVGLDIDKQLIKMAKRYKSHYRSNITEEADKMRIYNNIIFVQGNYVLESDSLLKLERSLYDTILCLSVTKWIHLNHGDEGLKRAFKRMYAQLKPGGVLVMECQCWKSYSRRKKLSKEIENNYRNIKFLPEHFRGYLLSPEVGFTDCEELGVPSNTKSGFNRPIQLYKKGYIDL